MFLQQCFCHQEWNTRTYHYSFSQFYTNKSNTAETAIWCPLPLGPKKFFHYCWVRVLLDAWIREILCDEYIMYQEAHYVTVLDKCHCKGWDICQRLLLLWVRKERVNEELNVKRNGDFRHWHLLPRNSSPGNEDIIMYCSKKRSWSKSDSVSNKLTDFLFSFFFRWP